MAITLPILPLNGAPPQKLHHGKTHSKAFGHSDADLRTEPSNNKSNGMVPPVMNDIIHAERCLSQLRSKATPIEKYIYLSMLKEQDPAMFYRLCLTNMGEFTPIIYTPTVGDACLQYSSIYRRPEGLVSLLLSLHSARSSPVQ